MFVKPDSIRKEEPMQIKKQFSVIHDSSTTRNELNDDLVKISNWAYQWKMSFNPDPNKQAQEVIFSIKTKKLNQIKSPPPHSNF